MIKSNASSFITKLKIAKNEKDAGLYLREFRNKKVKEFFTKHKLNVKPFYVSKIKDVRTFIEVNLTKGNDIIVNFWAKPFYKASDWGHYSLAAAINKNKITLCDPYPSHKTFWKVPIDELIRAMGKQFDGNERGFIVCSSL